MRSRERDAGGYIPWRGVTAVETPNGCDPILYLTCGHTVTWLLGQSLPNAARCLTCDPPTFRGKTLCGECGGSGSLPDMSCCPLCGGGGVVPSPATATTEVE